MTEKLTTKKNDEKLGINSDPLSLEGICENAVKYVAIVIPKEKITQYYVEQVIKKGRPYYYRYWYVNENGKRKRKKEYIGNHLPKGMKLGRQ